jgi:hypothetical protein
LTEQAGEEEEYDNFSKASPLAKVSFEKLETEDLLESFHFVIYRKTEDETEI